SDTRLAADQLYGDLLAEHIEVLYDDRDESPGVKFNDADLIGLPIRLTISERTLKQGNVEFKRRDSKEKELIPRSDVITHVKNEIQALKAAIQAQVVQVSFDE
ncbi:MAG TPA: His/Gly/Thr/Pro-type tRNA ligase C-terminal domain-containing protein, partial [Anaerolineales bacterium]